MESQTQNPEFRINPEKFHALSLLPWLEVKILVHFLSTSSLCVWEQGARKAVESQACLGLF